MINLTNFKRQWHGKTLEDAGCYVSEEYKSFQRSFLGIMKKIAKDLGGELVNPLKGHYFTGGFITRNGHYVYFNYEPNPRTLVDVLDKTYWNGLLIRTAENEKDYRGGGNNYCSIMNCQGAIDRLLNTEHIKW